MENVASMKISEREKITATLRAIYPDVVCHELNSERTSAQKRKRLYWTNFHVPIPEDRGIVINDILEDIPLTDPRWKKIPEKYLTPEGIVRISEATLKGYVDLEDGDVVDIAHPTSNTHRGRRMKGEGKLHTLTANMTKGNIPYLIAIARDRTEERLRIPADQEKFPTLRANMGTGGNNVPFLISDLRLWRPLTPIEVERAFNLDDDYTGILSKSRRLKCLGNTWEFYMILHILRHCPFFIPSSL